MVALQTLKGINSSLESTQSEISTGKSIGSAKDNAAVWSISKVMESDVQGFESISDSLSLGSSTVAVARQAAETVTDLLTQMKGKIVSAQEENVDRSKIQADIDALTDQVKSIVGAAQFNGLNLVNGSSDDAMKILSSLDRDASGSVTAKHISVSRQNLSVDVPVTSTALGTTAFTTPADVFAGTVSGTAATGGAAITPATLGAGAAETLEIKQVASGHTYQIELSDLEINTADGSTATGTRTFSFVAGDEDGTADVAGNLVSQMNAFFGAATDSALGYTAALDSAGKIVITNGSAADIGIGISANSGGTAGTSASAAGLGGLATIDVTTDAGAVGALSAIEGLINKATDAAAAFGSSESRIETQTSFISNLSDSMTSGIGSLVDADMEETSARLQALQTQQQLGIQALSIANSAPQNVLSLFK
jgi:flagellin